MALSSNRSAAGEERLPAQADRPLRVTLIDNYDSFTFNVFHAVAGLGAEVAVHRNDKIAVDEVLAAAPDAIVISPGPCTPKEAGISSELIRRAGPTVPVLGICLGMQALGEVYGAAVVRAPMPVHGKLSTVRHSGRGIFRGVNDAISATRYHSLIVDRDSLPDALEVTAETDDGLIMGLMHREHPVHGVQFHPESIASEQGQTLFRNFLDIALARRRERETAGAGAAAG